MEQNERTRDIYEEIGGYPRPPLVPLPEVDDPKLWEEMGINSNGAAHWIARAAMLTTGFRAFQKQLPHTIESMLRQIELRGAYLFTPVISATLALADDPRNLSPIERAATLLMAARNLYEDIKSGKFAPDQFRGQVLEMGQYPNLFSTSLIVDNKQPRMFKSTNVSQVTVAIARRFYSLKVWHPGSETTVEQLAEALTELARTARRNRLEVDAPSPGLLTCAMHSTQCRVFHKLQNMSVNRESLYALRHSFLTLCLDLDSYPSSDAEVAFEGHSGNSGNRWFHSSLQLVVFGNAKACAICNFSTYLDGNTMMRAASELQKRAAACPIENGAKSDFDSLPAATELKWKFSNAIVQRAQRELRMAQDVQQATFEIRDIGKNFFSAHNVESVPAFILALQMTAKRLTGKMIRITQFLTMSRYRYMDLVTAVVTTPEVIRFVEYMESDDVKCEQAKALLQEAIESQAQECRKARKHLPLSEIFSLFIKSRKGIRRLQATLVALFLNRLSSKKSLGREILVSHPEIYPEVPVVGRPGVRLPYVKYFGLHYQIFEEKIIITMMPSVTWTIPNAELITVLRESLQRIQWVVGTEK